MATAGALFFVAFLITIYQMYGLRFDSQSRTLDIRLYERYDLHIVVMWLMLNLVVHFLLLYQLCQLSVLS